MARRTIVQLEDDMHGGEAAETVSFGLDGKTYDLDLNAENAETLREVFAPYIASGRPTRAGRTTARRYAGTAYTPAAAAGADPATIRAWAVENGYAVSTRGRVSREVQEAYRSAVSG